MVQHRAEEAAEGIPVGPQRFRGIDRYGASEEDAAEKLKYDLFYVKNHNMFLDLVILVETFEVVLFGRGAR